MKILHDYVEMDDQRRSLELVYISDQSHRLHATSIF
jgi:hypothetical protein